MFIFIGFFLEEEGIFIMYNLFLYRICNFIFFVWSFVDIYDGIYNWFNKMVELFYFFGCFLCFDMFW